MLYDHHCNLVTLLKPTSFISKLIRTHFVVGRQHQIGNERGGCLFGLILWLVGGGMVVFVAEKLGVSVVTLICGVIFLAFLALVFSPIIKERRRKNLRNRIYALKKAERDGASRIIDDTYDYLVKNLHSKQVTEADLVIFRKIVQDFTDKYNVQLTEADMMKYEEMIKIRKPKRKHERYPEWQD